MSIEKEKSNLETKSHLDPVDIVGAIFAHSGLDSFPFNTRFLHDFFRKTQKSHRYSSLLEKFAFTPRGVDDLYSRRLDLDLLMLMKEDSLEWVPKGMNFGKLRMSDKARKEKIDAALKGDPSKKTQKLLKELGERFKKEVKRFYIEEKK